MVLITAVLYYLNKTMKQVIDFLTESKVQYFSTIGLDGKPKVRPFQCMFVDDGKLWYCTGNGKDVYKELMQNPYCELCTMKGMSWLRLSGKATFINDLDIKQRILDESPLVKNIYKTANNPVFETFYLDEASAAISEIGKAPIVINL